MCLCILSFYVVQSSMQSTYLSNVKNVLNKYNFIQNAILNIAKPAEKYFQAAMEETLPPAQRSAQTANPIESLGTSIL
jgi:hypothetical protein